MRNRRLMNSRVSVLAFAFLIFLTFFPGSILSAIVTLKSIKLYTTHKWIEKKPGVYFKCTGENKTFLPDVTKADVLYKFNGEESWQPMTELPSKKCKRCGVYEDLLGSDHVFDEWELCSSNFASSDGHYTHFKAKEINATFLCDGCESLGADTPPLKASKSDGGKGHYVVSVLITIVVVVLAIVVLVSLYKCWQKRKRQRDQARFLKLFEDDDDMDDELGLREMM